MSFDLFVGCFNNGERTVFPRQLIEHHFGPYVTHREPSCLTLGFAGDQQSYLFVDAAELVDGFCINRPCTSPELFEKLLGVMRSAPLALYMPGDCPPLVADENVCAQLPNEMVEALGQPEVLKSAQEISQWIQRA